MHNNPFAVTQFVKISKKAIVTNGDLFLSSNSESFSSFADEVYKQIGVAYPKFHKMDHLSKLGFLGAEILLTHHNLKQYIPQEKIGIILSNKNGSLDTDIKYSNLIKEGKTSPAVFVYTLPNIVIGEISIRHGLKGENTFFIADKFDIEAQVDYVQLLLDTDVMDACVCGWVELVGEEYACFMYLVEKNNPKSIGDFSKEQIQNWNN